MKFFSKKSSIFAKNPINTFLFLTSGSLFTLNALILYYYEYTRCDIKAMKYAFLLGLPSIVEYHLMFPPFSKYKPMFADAVYPYSFFLLYTILQDLSFNAQKTKAEGYKNKF